MRIGANYIGEGRCEFVVWAPLVKKLSLRIVREINGHERLDMEEAGGGYWKATAEGVSPGDLYLFNIDGNSERADPASHSQPSGIESPSEIIDHSSFGWEDAHWKGLPLSEMIIYEVHIGTFTPEGTFDAAVPRLDEIKASGINAIEVMPVSQFPGERNWGYDGVFHFAVQSSYGGPEGLKRFVNECHKRGIAVILDVVYNHFGPEGNYMAEFGPYFTDTCKTPWGMAINFDGPWSDEVRSFFFENALHWYGNYHFDGLRLDAIHAIYDSSARPFLKALKEKAVEFSAGMRPFYIIAESNLNDPEVIRKRELYGFGLDALWCDDFHHAMYSLLTDDRSGYYMDFGSARQLVKAVKEGFVYTGQYSKYRKRSFGEAPEGIPNGSFIVFSQNHDQVGNRMFGERLSALVPFDALKLSAGTVILSPFVPLLFMGEEYGEDAPFLYFIDHTDRGLVAATVAGRKEEFKEFRWQGEPLDPQSLNTFMKSKLRWEDRNYGRHKVLLDFYKRLIHMRKTVPALSDLDHKGVDASCIEEDKVILIRRMKDSCNVFMAFNFSPNDADLKISLPEGIWIKALDSADDKWEGPGSELPEVLGVSEEISIRGQSFGVYIREENS